MYTPVNPSFGLRGSRLYRHVFVMGLFFSRKDNKTYYHLLSANVVISILGVKDFLLFFCRKKLI